MPFANLKVPEGLVTAEQKQDLVTAVTDLYVGLFGERARATTMVLVEEVADGGWGIGGTVLTRAMLTADASPAEE
ncbi:4-oxalocrotonate tautomerase family protein [Streptomyces sp. NPDC006997]|uniref:tautomerase family protein n=1 Tax=Streptomyces sp. NPDC006997 TaxID=3155356 RepID=UPI0033DF22B5